jgi:hypothetical protein
MSLHNTVRPALLVLFLAGAAHSQTLQPIPPLPCADEPNLRSSSTGSDASIDFLNGTSQVIHIFNIDSNGRRELYRKLRPQYSYQEHSLPGQVWLVTTAANECLGIYRSGEGAQVVRLGDKPIISRRGIPPYTLRTTISDGRDLRPDGKGPYLHGKDGISTTVCEALNLWLDSLLRKGSPIRPCAMPKHQPSHTRLRAVRYDLSHPVPASGALDLGLVEDFDSGINVFWKHDHDGRLAYSIQAIPVGESSQSERVQFMLHIGGVRHTLHVGSWVPGEFSPTPGPIHGDGTSAARLTRVSETEWLVDAPAGTLARLWSRADPKKPKDLGLYRFSFQIRFELLPDMSQHVP